MIAAIWLAKTILVRRRDEGLSVMHHDCLSGQDSEWELIAEVQSPDSQS
jgi:hypothetical protein